MYDLGAGGASSPSGVTLRNGGHLEVVRGPRAFAVAVDVLGFPAGGEWRGRGSAGLWLRRHWQQQQQQQQLQQPQPQQQQQRQQQQQLRQQRQQQQQLQQLISSFRCVVVVAFLRLRPPPRLLPAICSGQPARRRAGPRRTGAAAGSLVAVLQVMLLPEPARPSAAALRRSRSG